MRKHLDVFKENPAICASESISLLNFTFLKIMTHFVLGSYLVKLSSSTFGFNNFMRL
jgi:hypothetical protein